VEQLERGVTGIETYEIASDEEMSVMEVANIVREAASDERGINVNIELVENPRSGETMVEEFGVDISKAQSRIGWEPNERVKRSVLKEIERDIE
jgi:UDP-glucose 4-epimerase